MSAFTDAIGAILTGGATGLLGAGLQYVGGYVTEKQKNKHQLALMAEDRTSMELEARLALSRIEAESEATRLVAEQHSFEKSLEQDRATYVPANADPRIAWVLVAIDFLRGLIRPIITLWMIYFLFRLHFDLVKLTGGLQSLPISELSELMSNVVLTTLYIATSVTLWWFGTRPPSPLTKKK